MFPVILNAKRLYGQEPGIKPSFEGKRSVSGDPFSATKTLWLDEAFTNGHHPDKRDINGLVDSSTDQLPFMGTFTVCSFEALLFLEQKLKRTDA